MPTYNPLEKRLIDVSAKGLIKTTVKLFTYKNVFSDDKKNNIRPQAINEALNRATFSAQEEFGKNNPSEAAKRWKVVIFLCSLQVKHHQPGTKTLNKSLEVALELQQWDVVMALCSLQSPAKIPGIEYIDKALEAAANSQRWDLVKVFFSLRPPARPPSFTALNKVLNSVATSNKNAESAKEELSDKLNNEEKSQESKFKILTKFKKTRVKPDNSLLIAQKSLLETEIQELTALHNELTRLFNRPNVPTGQSIVIQHRLIDLAKKGLVDTIQNICDSREKMKEISEEVIDESIQQAITSATFLKKEGKTLESNKYRIIVQTLCCLKWHYSSGDQKAVGMPSQKAIDTTLTTAIKSQLWDVVLTLCNLKPPARHLNQTLIDTALEAALNTKEWNVVQNLCNLQSPAVKPTHTLILKAQEQFTDKKIDDAVTDADWNLAYSLCAKDLTIRPSDEAIDLAFTELAQAQEWDKVKGFMVQGFPPSQMAISYAIRAAEHHNKLDVVHYLLKFQQPDFRVATAILYQAAQKGNYDIIKQICNLDEGNQPRLTSYQQAINMAQKQGHRQIARYLHFYMLIFKANVTEKPIQRSQILLDDYLNNDPLIFFNSHHKQVKKIYIEFKMKSENITSNEEAYLIVEELLKQLRNLKELEHDKAWMDRLDCIEGNYGTTGAVTSLEQQKVPGKSS